MFTNLPLTLAPFIVYNLHAFGLFGPTPGDPWAQPVFTVSMMSDARFTLLLSDLLVIAALIVLAIEVVKATRRPNRAIIDHGISTVVFVMHLVEFLLVRQAATSVFLILTVITFIDVVAGFTVTIRTASRDLTVDRGFE